MKNTIFYMVAFMCIVGPPIVVMPGPDGPLGSPKRSIINYNFSKVCVERSFLGKSLFVNDFSSFYLKYTF